jgi:hypothetical protein
MSRAAPPPSPLPTPAIAYLPVRHLDASDRCKEVPRHLHHCVRVAQLEGPVRDASQLDTVQSQRAYRVTKVVLDEQVPGRPCQQEVVRLDHAHGPFACGPAAARVPSYRPRFTASHGASESM